MKKNIWKFDKFQINIYDYIVIILKFIHPLFFSDGTNATQSYNCTNTAFLYHGYRTTGMTVYDMFFPVNEWECHDSCRDDNTCLGYTYRNDNMLCSLSHDTIHIDALPCNLCRFFEKTCHSCMYKTTKESIKNVLFFNILSHIYRCFVMLSIWNL